MKTISAFSVIAGLAAGLQVAAAGDITGTITLKGTPPPDGPIPAIKEDVNCGKFHTTVPTTHHWVVGSKGELANVVVMLKGMAGKSTGATAPPEIMDQKGCEYVPSILAIQTNQKLVVKNSDPVMHNIHPTPAAAGNKEENKAQMPGGPELTFTYPSAETFLRFKCDVHPWMFSYACITDHPYGAVTDKDGKYTLKDVKDGKYTMEVYHRKAAPATAPVTKEVEVKGGNL